MRQNISKTINYYENNFKNLIERYEKADLSFIQNLLLENIKKDDFILELGFGSGRELNFLFNKGFKNIYGIDASKNFVDFVKNRFKIDNFRYSILPDINIKGKFDFIYSIAVFMHLPYEIYEETINNISNKLKKGGKLLISFSLEKREDKERDFYKVDEKLLEKLLNNNQIYKEKEIITTDTLGRNIKWKNIIYRKMS